MRPEDIFARSDMPAGIAVCQQFRPAGTAYEQDGEKDEKQNVGQGGKEP
jgi:hypothetical protein